MPKPEKLTIHRWACDHDLSVHTAKLCHQAVSMAEMMWEVSKRVRSGELDQRLPARPPADAWLRLYRQHRHVFRAVVDIMPDWDLSGAEADEVISSGRAVGLMARDNPAKLKRLTGYYMRRVSKKRVRAAIRLAIRRAHKDYRAHLQEMMDIANGEPDPYVNQVDDLLTSSHEFHFFLRVVIVCIIEFNRLPIDLLRVARQGDEAAIEKLLRLDDQMLHEPAIERWINGCDGAMRIERRRLAMAWIDKGPTGQNHPRHFKQCVGGLISALSKRASLLITTEKGKVIVKPQPLNAPQIEKLFHAWYRDRHQRRQPNMKDPDVLGRNGRALTPDAWSRRIREYRKLWDRILFRGQPDK